MRNERLREALHARGLTYEQVAEEVGVDPKTAQRWVTEGRVSYPRYRYALTKVLGRSATELWPELTEAESPGLTGEWWSCWQTMRAGGEVITTQPVRLDQVGDVIHIENLERGVPIGQPKFPWGEGADYLWRGELRIWRDTTLMGWYASTDPGIRSHGTLFLRLHPHGVEAVGRWVGESYDGPIVTGWGVLARSREAAESTIQHVVTQGINDTVS